VLKGFFAFLVDEGIIDRSPMARIDRPRLPKAEDRDVVTIGAGSVRAMFGACECWQERLCLGVLAYLGPRRSAAARARWRDVDFELGTIRFHEKGDKVAVKPLPDELRELLIGAIESGEVPTGATDWLIPSRRPASVRHKGERSSKMVWETVRKVAKRAGVRAHPHALRAAFACLYLETNPNRIAALQALMGHEHVDTTMRYLRMLNRDREMETVRGLSWATPTVEQIDTPYRIRTGVAAVRGRRPRPLAERGAADIVADTREALNEQKAARRGRFPMDSDRDVLPSSRLQDTIRTEPVLPP
jgi:integrase